MAHWIGAHGQLKWVKNSKKFLFVTSPRENLTPKPNNFFKIGTSRLVESVDSLNSSLAQSAGELIEF